MTGPNRDEKVSRTNRKTSGGPRPASTYRAARIPSRTMKVRGVYPHKIDRKTWKALRAKRWNGNGAQEMARRVRQAAEQVSAR